MLQQFELIKSLELELVSPATRKDRSRLSQLLADDFEEFGSSGNIYHKVDVLDRLPNSKCPDYDLSDFQFVELASDCILVRYNALVDNVRSRRSSIWKQNELNWQLVHHQSTIVVADG